MQSGNKLAASPSGGLCGSSSTTARRNRSLHYIHPAEAQTEHWAPQTSGDLASLQPCGETEDALRLFNNQSAVQHGTVAATDGGHASWPSISSGPRPHSSVHPHVTEMGLEPSPVRFRRPGWVLYFFVWLFFGGGGGGS